MFLFGPPQPLGTSEVIPPPSGWAARTDVPASINPAGTLWLVEKEWTFDGPAGSPPPAPWHTGPEWAGAHAQLGGHVWRNSVTLDSHAYLDGNGNLVLKVDYNPTYGVCTAGYLLTDQDWVTVRPDDYVLTHSEDGFLLEFVARFPTTQPRCCWIGLWTYVSQDQSTPEPGYAGNTSHEEIDLCEKVGLERPYYDDRFFSYTHGRRSALAGDGAAEGGWPVHEGFKPQTMWSGASPRDGNFHTWSLLWDLRNQVQKFYYDGHLYWTRPMAGKEIHNLNHGIRISWEASWDHGGWQGPVVDLAQDPFPCTFEVANVRVLRRRLAPTVWSITALSADKAEGNS